MVDVFLARQPIFDSQKKVFAYEILYRQGQINSFFGAEPDEASSNVIIDTFLNFGITDLTQGKPAFINFTGNLIEKEIATLFPNDLLVVELLETVDPKPDLIEKCMALKEKGYTIALDDFVYRNDYQRLIELADIIKIDFLATNKNEIKNIIGRINNPNIKFLAEKIETYEEFEYAQRLGFSFFQGFFFGKPQIASASSLTPLKTNYLRLITKVHQRVIDFDELAQIISQDISLTYNLLRLVNSAAFGFKVQINGVKQALVLLGEREIKKWVTLIALTGIGEGEGKPDEIIRLSLIRARFAELLAQKTAFRDKTEDFFLCGLFSLADALLNKPLTEVLDQIQISNDIKEALLNKNGQLKDICQLVLAYEKGNWEDAVFYADLQGIKHQEIIAAYMDSLLWYSLLLKC